MQTAAKEILRGNTYQIKPQIIEIIHPLECFVYNYWSSMNPIEHVRCTMWLQNFVISLTEIGYQTLPVLFTPTRVVA